MDLVESRYLYVRIKQQQHQIYINFQLPAPYWHVEMSRNSDKLRSCFRFSSGLVLVCASGGSTSGQGGRPPPQIFEPPPQIF